MYTKESALIKIRSFIEKKLRYDYSHSRYLQEEVMGNFAYYFSCERVEKYRLLELSNGFYLGEMRGNDYHGYGAYVWTNGAEPNSMYIGEWRDDKKNGAGAYLMSTGMCYCGEFKNGNFHDERAYLTNYSGLEVDAEFSNDQLIYVWSANHDFTFNGKRYSRTRY